MKLIPTKCPNCGASIEIDVTQNTYKCEYCRTTFTDADFKRVEINQTITNKNIDEAEVQKQKTDQMYNFPLMLHQKIY